MKRCERLQIEAAARVLDAAGIPWSVVKQGKHRQVLALGERIGISGTPRDEHNACEHVRQAARRLVGRVRCE